MNPRTAPMLLLSVFVLCAGAAAQSITVDIASDVVDVDWQTATIADLPGPDGRISLSEALIAANHTPGHQTIAFAIPQSEWILQFVLPGRAVLTSVTGYFFQANDPVTIDGTTQTAFTGNTNPDGHEVAIYGLTLNLNAAGCTLKGFDSTNVSLNAANGLIDGNTGSMNISLFGGGNSTISNNQGGTIKIDRSNDNVVVGNVVSRVRVLGGGPDATGNRIGGPTLAERNIIKGYGSYNSEGLPSGSTVQLFRTVDTLIENNWIGTPDGLTYGDLASTQGILLETHNEGVVIRDNLIAGIKGLGIGPHYAGFLFGRAVLVSGSGDGLVMTGNTIGLDVTGAPTLGSVTGLDLGDPVTHPLGMTNVVIGGVGPGEGNEIGGHVLNGVLVGRNTQNVRLTGNSIHDNGALGIDLITSGFATGVTQNDPLDADAGGNGLQNFPVLAAAVRESTKVRVVGQLDSTPSDEFTIEFFASPSCDPAGFGEGRMFLGGAGVQTDAAGHAAFDVQVAASPPANWVVTATAIREPSGASSEFSSCVTILEQFCQADLGFGGPGGAVLTLCGDPLDTGGQAVLALRQAAPLALALLVAGPQPNPTSFLGGTLLPVPIAAVFVLGTDAAGEFSATLSGGGGPATVYAQFAIADSAQPHGAALSNAIRVDVGP